MAPYINASSLYIIFVFIFSDYGFLIQHMNVIKHLDFRSDDASEPQFALPSGPADSAILLNGYFIEDSSGRCSGT